jgi:structural maintenance of chromosome 1
MCAQTRPGGQRARFQSIVISLKDNFFEKADGLVGIARDVAGRCSATYTFDLTRFGAG